MHILTIYRVCVEITSLSEYTLVEKKREEKKADQVFKNNSHELLSKSLQHEEIEHLERSE